MYALNTSYIDIHENLNVALNKSLATDLVLGSLTSFYDNFNLIYQMTSLEKNIDGIIIHFPNYGNQKGIRFLIEFQLSPFWILAERRGNIQILNGKELFHPELPIMREWNWCVLYSMQPCFKRGKLRLIQWQGSEEMELP